MATTIREKPQSPRRFGLHRSSHGRLGVALLTNTLAALPYARRYGALCKAARILSLFLGFSRSHRLQQRIWSDDRRLSLNTPHEAALAVLINAATRARLLFQPRVVVHSEETFDRAMDRGKGVLLVAPHAQLSVLILRYLHDRGIAYHGVAADDLNVVGTEMAAPILRSSPNLLLKARRVLSSQGVLVAMIDRSKAEESRVTEFSTPSGSLRISRALPELADRFNVSVVFFMATASPDGDITLRFKAPSKEAEGDVALTVEEFANFCMNGVGIGAGSGCLRT